MSAASQSIASSDFSGLLLAFRAPAASLPAVVLRGPEPSDLGLRPSAGPRWRLPSPLIVTVERCPRQCHRTAQANAWCRDGRRTYASGGRCGRLSPIDAEPGSSRDRSAATRRTSRQPTRDLLIDFLISWKFLAQLPATTAQPRGGTDVDIGELLRKVDHRLLGHSFHPDDLQAQMALADVHHAGVGRADVAEAARDDFCCEVGRWPAALPLHQSDDRAGGADVPVSTSDAMTCLANFR